MDFVPVNHGAKRQSLHVEVREMRQGQVSVGRSVSLSEEDALTPYEPYTHRYC